MGTVLRHGSEEQKNFLLPKIASGEARLQAFGVSEPNNGTDTMRSYLKSYVLCFLCFFFWNISLFFFAFILPCFFVCWCPFMPHSLETTATLDGDHYVINGQKMWTSRALYSDYMILLARTGAPKSASPKERRYALSVFLLDMNEALQNVSVAYIHHVVHSCFSSYYMSTVEPRNAYNVYS
jgi:alkylation response protein AidB-like acyl-CoA dehydrogenase